MMIKRIAIPLVLASMALGICSAQNVISAETKSELKFYRLDLTVKETGDSGVTNSRTYSTIASTERDGFPSVRTGSKIPIVRTSGEITYDDVGVNVDYRAIKEQGDSLSLVVSVEVTSLASDRQPPVIRQNRWSGAAIVPFRKATSIFSSDDVASKGKLQVELTATPVKQ